MAPSALPEAGPGEPEVGVGEPEVGVGGPEACVADQKQVSATLRGELTILRKPCRPPCEAAAACSATTALEEPPAAPGATREGGERPESLR